MGIKIGVCALQGDVSEHIRAFEAALSLLGEGGDVFPFRKAADIPLCDAIVLPGGESTTISHLLKKNNMYGPLRTFKGGIFATCAGLVLIGREVDDPRVEPLGIMDIAVGRNAFGRQRDSCEMAVTIAGDDQPFCGYFIRAPVIVSVGPEATPLCYADHIVGAVQGPHMGLSFHPELGGDLRLHLLFLERLRAYATAP
ncbi:pyridoxal 5'-phosphate synthase glutaminase subunit PdxT [Methanogenium organophilum]|uniref:glutaminase n=1 Tax=Methanogenium organophilum TaxID=2199 RepID=A0A9X9T9A4_METOG|nr:pyridoxal 5'-phosphate synthase glutaminase subunit PdxT [Methanogenium organophilum]WAI02440.1 pyridoxal 5'-phosphate synthase glutaminase subunit PdxT [Methanogenium organophilum]